MDLTKTANKLKRSSVSQQVYEAIQTWIVNGELNPGEKIKDKELAEALGVSRTPVREALLRLENEGFVVTKANRWTQVAMLDLSEANRIYPIVWTLEMLAVETLIDFKLAYIDKLEYFNQKLTAALNNRNGIVAAEMDESFHSVIVHAANNPELSSILKPCKMKIRRIEIAYFEGFSGNSESLKEHEDIIYALKNEDFIKAAQYVEANWKSSLARIQQQLK